MKQMNADTVVAALAALAQETRLGLFRLLVEAGPAGLAAGTIAEALGVAPPTLSFHLKELVHANLIQAAPQGRYIVYRADFDAMNALIGYLTDNCCRMSCDPECASECAPAAQTRHRASQQKPAPALTRRRIP